jgi:hypothetical protein
MAPEIPGYYFDSDKKKYFKIQPNHLAPSDSKYSQQAVKAEGALKQEQVRKHAQRKLKAAATVKRSKLLNHPLTRVARRIDGNPKQSARRYVAEYFAASLAGQAAVTESPLPAGRSTSLGTNITFTATSGQFAIDPVSGIMFADVDGTSGYPVNRARPDAGRLTAYYRSIDAFSDTAPRQLSATVPLSSLYTTDPQLSTKIMRCFRVELLRSLLPGSLVLTEPFQRAQAPPTSRLRLVTCPTEPCIRRHDMSVEMLSHGAITDLAVRSADGFLAQATSESLSLIDTSSMLTPTTLYDLTDNTNVKDLLRIAYKDHNVILGGTRSGKLLLFDVRIPPSESLRTAVRVQHSAAITSLFPLGSDQNAILATGIPHCSVYDLRYTPSPVLKCHMPRSNTYHHTKPTLNLSIPDSRQQIRFGLGISYDPELNVLLSASTDFHHNHRVGLWDVSTGKMLNSPLSKMKFQDAIICSQIVDYRDGRKSIVLSDGKKFWEWNASGVLNGKDGSEDDMWHSSFRKRR